MRAGLTIGQLGRELQLNPKTVRYYEGIGLLPGARRSESGYRLYAKDDVERLRLVKRAKLLGLSLSEIKEIIDYAMNGHCDILQGRLLSLVETKLNEIDQKIDDLIAFRDDLRRYHRDLSQGSKCEVSEKPGMESSVSCYCISETVEDFGK